MADLSGVFAKLRRGDEHFRTLRSEVLAWMQSKPYGFFLKPDASDPERKRVFICLDLRKPPLSTRWGVVLGDSLSCYRAALDHTVYALAVLSSGQNPPPGERSCQFPICDEKDSWHSANTQRRIADLRTDMRAAIQNAQPCFGAKPPAISALTALRELNDRDKHRLLHLVALLPNAYEVTAIRGPRLTSVVPASGPVEHEAPALTVSLAEPLPAQPNSVEMKVTLTLFIGVENPQISGKFFGVTTAADSIRRATRDAVGRIERFAR